MSGDKFEGQEISLKESTQPPILGFLKIQVPRIQDLGTSDWVIFLPEVA